MSDKYILAADGRTPIRASLKEWGDFFGNNDARRVAADELPGGVRVSTIFLGLNHNWGDGPPLLWETMIFGGDNDQWQYRYSSYEDAVAGHARAVRIAKGEESDT